MNNPNKLFSNIHNKINNNPTFKKISKIIINIFIIVAITELIFIIISSIKLLEECSYLQGQIDILKKIIKYIKRN